MTHSTNPSGTFPLDTDGLRDLPPARRAGAVELPEETAAETAELRRQAAELLSRSRWWRDECRRELLLARRWHGVRE
jgi:hypothetical protein